MAVPEASPASPKELISGVDALYLSGYADVPERLNVALQRAKAAAVMFGREVPFALGPLTGQMEPHGFGRYPYSLRHEWGRIGVAPESRLPPFRIQPNGEFLHGAGALVVVERVEGLLEDLCGLVRLGTARIDLFADFLGLDFTKHDDDRFVSRATAERTYGENGAWTGFSFGTRGVGIFGRAYAKTVELRGKATYWWEIWGTLPDGASVVRIEFELLSRAIREFGVREPREVLEAVGALWHYLTCAWLTLRDRGEDHTRARWPVAPEWRAVQAARLAEESQGIERMRAARREVGIEVLLPALMGYSASLAELLGTDDLDETLDELSELLRTYAQVTRRSFASRVADKAAKA